MSFRNFAGNARQRAAAIGLLSEIQQVRNLVVLRRWRDEDGQLHQESFSARCYADFAEPKDGQNFLGDQVIATQDYVVRGLDLLQREKADYIDTASGFWLDGQIVAGEIQGGIACDLLSYKQHLLTLDLYLRKKPDER